MCVCVAFISAILDKSMQMMTYKAPQAECELNKKPHKREEKHTHTQPKPKHQNVEGKSILGSGGSYEAIILCGICFENSILSLNIDLN